ncbi:ERF superfamily protein [Symmachiella dynata]|uniref:ERF family protein n=1 Tax=Symmachiella dynata TaxID=2527995 RepID=UPI00118BA44C|nr:ERF family protein [Symmachiella dynata]QDT46211.1 ERF superfamily protein [Symmachiella dynata]
MSTASIQEKLIAIQSSLKSPKSQTNAFGKYNYRSCEDILEAVKPLLMEQNLVLTISDDIVEVGGRVYVKATAAVSVEYETDKLSVVAVTAFAREAEQKKGMDEAQITGAASSYARKYALNGLFCIDDTKDADATNDHKETQPSKKYALPDLRSRIDELCTKTGTDLNKLKEHYGMKEGDAFTEDIAKKAIADLELKLSKQVDPQSAA